MKVLIDADEWYPVYYLSDCFGTTAEVPEETIARWKKVFEEFDQAQNEIKKAYNGEEPHDSTPLTPN